MYDPLRPETLLLMKSFLLAEKTDYFWGAKEHSLDQAEGDINMLDDYELYPDELRDLIGELQRGWLVFDREGDWLNRHKKVPVRYELLTVCLSQRIPTILTFRGFLWEKSDGQESIYKLLEREQNGERRERNKAKMKELFGRKERKILLPIEEVSEVISSIVRHLRQIAEPYAKQEEELRRARQSFDAYPFPNGEKLKTILAGNKPAESEDADTFFRGNFLFDVELIHQSKEFFVSLQQALNEYVGAIIEVDIPLEGVMPWNEQLAIVRSELRLASAGRNAFSVDHRNFTRKFSSIGSGIPSTLRPIECLFIMERHKEITIKSLQKEDIDDDDAIQIDLAYGLGMADTDIPDKEPKRKENLIYIGSTPLAPPLLSEREKEILDVVLKNCNKGDHIHWEDIFSEITGSDVGLTKGQLSQQRRSMNDSRGAINEKASQLAGRELEVIGLVPRKSTYVCNY